MNEIQRREEQAPPLRDYASDDGDEKLRRAQAPPLQYSERILRTKQTVYAPVGLAAELTATSCVSSTVSQNKRVISTANRVGLQTPGMPTWASG